MAVRKLVDNATSNGVYGIGGKDGDYFHWSTLMPDPHPRITLIIQITGEAVVELQGAPYQGDILVPVSGGSYNSSIQDGIFAELEYFAFNLNILSGAVNIWMVYRST